MLEPWSPKIADGEKPDKEEGALVIPANTKVGENPINNTKLAIQKRLALDKVKIDKKKKHSET
jgi:hypothetical protein